MAFAIFFLAEYANIILIAALTATFFLGGWLSPFEGLPAWLGGESVLAEPAFVWFALKLAPFLFVFLVYFISGVAETNRAPFDVAEGESEIVAGFHVEYSGMAFAIFFLAEYANIILIAALTATFFLGGWLSPFEGLPAWLGGESVLAEPAFVWFALKLALFLFVFLWLRATFPRYRYDQIMRLGWKVFIPVTIVWIGVEMILAAMQVGPWAP